MKMSGARVVRRALLCGIVLTGIAGFATVKPPIVQVRDYPHAPSVAIVAWSPDQPAYGLRSGVRRNGSLERDHQLYVSNVYLGFTSAAQNPRYVQMLWPSARKVETTWVAKDSYNCHDQSRCSPPTYLGARIPDKLLRENRDSLVLRFPAARSGLDEMIIMIRRDMIDPYLAAVDSVVAALKVEGTKVEK